MKNDQTKTRPLGKNAINDIRSIGEVHLIYSQSETGGKATGVRWNFALTVNWPRWGRDARLATKTPGSPLLNK